MLIVEKETSLFTDTFGYISMNDFQYTTLKYHKKKIKSNSIFKDRSLKALECEDIGKNT